ncbi:MAG: metallothionein [Synechococcaceae cyanobacterium RL_1_2]|nr:metallothionein [Synechococcaceae cyanobacterium RL_1_2]
MTTLTEIKCACPSCVCLVDIASAITKDDKHYCSDACASGHPQGSGCGHEGCGCHH